MQYLSLYRKYRPKSFKEVVGQEYIVQILQNSIKNNAVANAYVFAGTKGTGKTSIAKIYANAINCLDNQNGDVCGKCEICQDFANNQVIDVLELDAASNNGVDEIRKISDNVYTLPAKLNKKVYILDEAHMLTTSAWNALLKVVEEPPRHVIFIFATTEMHKIPGTILSRCQCLRFNKIENSKITNLLVRVCENEKFTYDLDALKVIAEIADGSARDALSILEQTATFSNNQINAADVYKIYGLLSPKDVIDFLNLISTGKNNNVFLKANNYYQSGVNFVSLANLIIAILTDKLIYLKTQNPKLLTRTNESTISQLTINDVNTLIKLLDIWQDTYVKIIVPTDVHVIFEHALIKSMSCFENEPAPVVQKVAPQPKQEQPKQETKPQIKTEVIQPTIKMDETVVQETFVEPTMIITPMELPKQEAKPIVSEQKEIVMPSISDILFATVSNRDKQAITDARKFLDDIKSNIINEKPFGSIKLASQVFCASPNAIVLAFKDELDAKILNKGSFTRDFILATCKIFKNPKFIIGYSINELNNSKAVIQKAMQEKKEKLNIEALRNVLNSDLTIWQLAFNTIYDKDEDKNKK